MLSRLGSSRPIGALIAGADSMYAISSTMGLVSVVAVLILGSGQPMSWGAMSEENDRITRRHLWYGAPSWDANNEIVTLSS